jgi:queuine/archaeosine tRNA-ribosyltransferase
VYSSNKRIDPQQALHWQMRFCDVGVILDTPPGPPKARRDFRDCLARTVAATRMALPFYRDALDAGTQFRWWGVVQGRTKDEMEHWWTAIRRVYPFESAGEGWAFKPYPFNDPEALADALDFMRERSIQRAHIFGQSSPLVVETLLSLGPKAGLEFVTFDSTSPITFANNALLVMPARYGWKFVRKDVREYMLSCICVSCTFLRQELKEDRSLEVDRRFWRKRMTFHNMLVMLSHFEQLERQYMAIKT